MTAGVKRADTQDESDSARELREKKRVLAALVVHDLRSPLSAIQGYLELLREEISSYPDAKQANGYIDDATTLLGKALGLVATILDVDELEDGILHANIQPVRLIELVDRARAGARPHFEVRQLGCDVEVDPDMLVNVDRELFGRVIENLLDNATRYAPRGGRCAIAARFITSAPPSGGADTRGQAASVGAASLEVAIGNNGPPVPEAERDRIFGRYFQVERRRASARANRGLGLYFCKLAIEAHGGTIHVETRGELGAVFVVRLPKNPAIE